MAAALVPDGGAIRLFEDRFAEFVGMKHGLFLPFGRSALSVYFRAFKIANRKVIIAAYNCRVVGSTIASSGNTPLFIDCAENSFNMDLEKAVDAIDDNTAALVFTAMYGYPFDCSSLQMLRRCCPDVVFIGDAALALFTKKEEQHFCKSFDFSFFAFGIGKQMSTVEGGMLVTDSDDIYEKAKMARVDSLNEPNALIGLKRRMVLLASTICFSPAAYPLLYYLSEKTSFLHSLKGSDIGISDLVPRESLTMPSRFQASIGLSQLDKLEQNRCNRERIIRRYFDALVDVKAEILKLPPFSANLSHFPVLSSRRNDLAKYLTQNGIHATNMFGKMPADLPLLKPFCLGDYPRAREITDQCLLLPLYPQMTAKQQDKVIKVILSWQP